ncbi:MAG: glycoside hydrolase family 2 protein [Lentisphaerae bacterium]|nr:glycoside hydrolase family 2 protein [Lentisphaerota bacterium]
MQKLDLTGAWTLSCPRRRQTVRAQVPGDTHSALLAAGAIPDPYWADNEQRVQWIGRETWIYSRTFELPASFLKERSVFLHSDSLDTVADIAINDQRVAHTANMFTRHRFEVKSALRPGRNDIRIVFTSPELAAKAEARRLPYPIPCSTYPVQSPHRNLLRKVQCHAGWDWGPSLMVSGINGALYLGATSQGRIEYVTTTQTHGRHQVAVEVCADVEAPADGRSTLDITLGDQTASRDVVLRRGRNLLRHTVTLPRPKLWWPQGHGSQPLYALTVRVAGDVVRKRLGLRTIEVVNTEDKHGLSMTFRINGRDVFCKGANWIPCDGLPQRQTRAVVDDLLTSAVQANMNMLRVWGGGQYESDDFYDLCDEKGLLVWQDFMFSCALYPATPTFLEQVREEARHQVRRLRDHACLALWCGNNEDVGALGWFAESKQNRDRYLVDYDRLNEGVLGQAVDACDPTRMFWPSSPCGGRGDYSDCWHDDSRGDMHYWSVWHEGKSFDAYYKVNPRFCSEFGYQSFPSLDTIRTYAPADQFNVTAPVMEYHQRNPGGNARIMEMFGRYFRAPEGFANFVYLSQVQQGLAIKTAVEYWRSLRPTCMGTLYWQLNDNWPVCSWSSVEYGGKWKLLHHMARRFYDPVLVSVRPGEGGRVELWLTNDGPAPLAGRLTLRVMDFAGRVRRRVSVPVRVPAGSAKRIKRFAVQALAPEPEKVFLSVALTAGGRIVRNEHFFRPYKQCDLARAAIRLATTSAGGAFRVTIRTDRPAFYVSLNADGIRGEFDDNAFTLLPGEPRALVFTPKQRTTLKAFRAALSLRHLRETY